MIDTENFNLKGWVAQTVPGSSGPSPLLQELYLAVATVNDFAQTQYVGWGFRMSLRQSADLGICSLYVDGVQVTAPLDLAAGAQLAWVHTGAIVIPTPGAPLQTAIAVQVTGGGAGTGIPLSIVVQDIPLGMHRVKLVPQGASRIAATTGVGAALIFPAIEVIH